MNLTAAKESRIMIITFRQIKAYWVNFLITLISYPIYIATMYFLWKAIMANSSVPVMGLGAIVTYYVLTWATSTTNQRVIGAKFSHDVRKGELAIYLVRPVKYIKFRFFNQFANYLFFFVPLMLIVCVLSFFFHLAISSDLLLLGLFLLTAFLAYVLAFLIFFIVGETSFWIEHNAGIIDMMSIVGWFFSGLMIPLELLSGTLSQIAYFMPFRFMAHFPVSIVMGRISLDEIISLLMIEMVWITALYLTAVFIWKIGVKRFKGYGI